MPDLDTRPRISCTTSYVPCRACPATAGTGQRIGLEDLTCCSTAAGLIDGPSAPTAESVPSPLHRFPSLPAWESNPHDVPPPGSRPRQTDIAQGISSEKRNPRLGNFFRCIRSPPGNCFATIVARVLNPLSLWLQLPQHAVQSAAANPYGTASVSSPLRK